MRGEQVYARCLACHALAYDRVGPRHCGLLGRKAGSVPGFAYTQAMKDSGLTWDAATLDRFLADPLKTVPGTAMTYAFGCACERRAHQLTRLRYSLVRVSISILSPIAQNSGTLSSKPVLILAGLSTLPEVSPRTAGSV
ncbi:cytochrome c [Bordetella pertussis]|nr:cytochrome c [Bordetella pertussis]